MAVQQDDQIAVNVADLVWSGSLSGDISNDSAAVPPAGILSVQANTNNGVVPIDDLPVAFYDPSQTFSGESKLQNQLRNVTLLGSPVVFNTAAVGSDNAGEFAVFALDDTFNSTYAYRELGFAGTPTSSLPTTGINIFHGPLLVSLKNITSDEFESYSYSSQMFVNWHSNKVFGVIVTPGPSPGDPLEANGFFFGDVTATQSGNQFSNVHFVGMDVVGFDSTTTGPGPGPGPAVDMPLTIEGSTSFAQFYGSQTQGIGLVANGTTIDVQTQVAQENWLITAAGYRDTTTLASTTGTVNWQGFAVGIGEDMNQIDVNRRLYMNLNPADFSLTIDRDNGTFTGSLTLTDQDDPSAMISNLQIGGSNGSAYISDHLLIAEIGGGTPIFVSPSSGPLKTYGNYLITEDPSGQQLASYASWGTWEIAYSEPVTGKDYHVHNPGSLWVAGQPTPAADLAALAASSFIGVYNGKAEGVAIPSSGSFARLPTGTFSMTVDFGTSMLTSGSINFPAGDINPAVNFGIDPISIPGNGFSASISSPNFGTVNGAFFGPNAASVAGNFDAQDGTLRYIGVFGGDR